MDKNFIREGELLSYTISYSNYGEKNASRILLIQVLPEGVTFKKSKSKPKPKLFVLDNGVNCLVWDIEKKLKSGSKPNILEYTDQVDNFYPEIKR